MNTDLNQILDKYKGDATRLMDILTDIQTEEGCIPSDAVAQLSERLGISRVEVEQTISFYHFFSQKPVGKYAVYLNDSAVAEMKGRTAVAAAFEQEAGCTFGSVTEDGVIGLHNTACIGMNDQEPAAIVNGVVFTNLTADKAKELVAGMRAGKAVQEMVTELGDGVNSSDLVQSMVKNNIQKKGDVIFSTFESGSAIKKCIEMAPEAVIDEVKSSNLRGRGGAGFPTGLKWEFCSKAAEKERYLICNADEGEPGTFKDRVILTETPQLVVEGMIVGGYALGAQQGIIYLRAEYTYLKKYLESVLDDYRQKNLLGNNIAGKEGFNFDLRIQFGAGAYVCGEESALIESAEGKRGEPRIRPPFPVEKGYLDKPTSVNNVESFAAVSQILVKGAAWFKGIGNDKSAGTKVLSISGDCEKPGVYEVAWGLSVQEMLDMVGASNTKAVLVGGPSGTFVGAKDFSRKICFGDLATGGSVIVFDQSRDILETVSNFVDFFCDESCGSCVPCRAGNGIIRSTLDKVINGKGTKADLEKLTELGTIMKAANRCGLGQTSFNPVVTTIKNLPEEYESRLQEESPYVPTFDLAASVADSCEYVGREPNL